MTLLIAGFMLFFASPSALVFCSGCTVQPSRDMNSGEQAGEAQPRTRRYLPLK